MGIEIRNISIDGPMHSPVERVIVDSNSTCSAMKLKYKVKNTLEGFEVSLDVKPIIVTEEMIRWAMSAFNKNEYNAKELCIEAAKNEVHWQFCKRNANLDDYVSGMRDSLYRISDVSEENRKSQIKNAHRALHDFFAADKKSVY